MIKMDYISTHSILLATLTNVLPLRHRVTSRDQSVTWCTNRANEICNPNGLTDRCTSYASHQLAYPIQLRLALPAVFIRIRI